MNKDIKRVEEDKDAEIKRLNNIADKLEQRIATLEKVLASHAKCIGEMRTGTSNQRK
jgi:exonuclease VII small subunit|tara:strand:- start:276 stop:446 length:171 start_codon:yes stop_codon:yes gene_type:complete